MGTANMPETIQRSDKHAQHIFKKAHDNAKKEYGKGARPHKVAYAALKNEHKKKGDRWEKK